MTIEQFKRILNQLEIENNYQLEDINDKLEILESDDVRYQREKQEALDNIRELEYLEFVKNNFPRNIHMYFPIGEIPLSILIICLMLTMTYSPSTQLLFAFMVTMMFGDMHYVDENIYKRISSEKNIFKRLISVIKKSFKSLEEIAEEIKHIRDYVTKLNRDHQKNSRETKRLEESRKFILSELQAIDLNLQVLAEKEKESEEISEQALSESIDLINERKLELRSR